MFENAPDPALVAQMLRKISGSNGFNAWLGVELLSVETGRVEIGFALQRDELTQHHGATHGGIIATAADIVCAWAAASVVGDVVTGGFSIQFLSLAQGSRLRAVGQVLKAGKRQVSVEAKVYADQEQSELKLVAVALGSISPVVR